MLGIWFSRHQAEVLVIKQCSSWQAHGHRNGKSERLHIRDLLYITDQCPSIQTREIPEEIGKEPRYRLVCICFPTPGRGLPYGSGLGLSRCLGPGECLHSIGKVVNPSTTGGPTARIHQIKDPNSRQISCPAPKAEAIAHRPKEQGFSTGLQNMAETSTTLVPGRVHEAWEDGQCSRASPEECALAVWAECSKDQRLGSRQIVDCLQRTVHQQLVRNPSHTRRLSSAAAPVGQRVAPQGVQLTRCAPPRDTLASRRLRSCVAASPGACPGPGQQVYRFTCCRL